MAIPDWQHYQERAAAVFERLGCSVAVDAKVKGARSVHQVDVLVRFSGWGLPQVWVVECKYLKRRVNKAAVAAFKSIVEDIGADKGFLLSEVGFQTGAVSAANLTNLSLLSLQSLDEAVTPDFQRLRLAQLEIEILGLRKNLLELRMDVPRGTWGAVTRGKPGVNSGHIMGGVGALLFLLDSINAAKLGEYRGVVPRSFLDGEGPYVRIVDSGSLLAQGVRLVSEVRSWVSKQPERIRRAERLLAFIHRSRSTKAGVERGNGA